MYAALGVFRLLRGIDSLLVSAFAIPDSLELWEDMSFLVIAFIIILLLRLLFNAMAKREIIRLFSNHSVLVCGEKGSGKDLLFGYVVRRRKRKYISNVDYGGVRIPFDPISQWSLGGNRLANLVEGTLTPYEYPYDDNIDYYISDGGCYFPCQENSLLNRRYPSVPLFAALSRHLGDCRIHMNVQSPNRIWDKLREQATRYIWIEHSKLYFGKFVRMKLYLYERLSSCQDHVRPMRSGGGKFGKAERRKSEQTYGMIRKHVIWFKKNYQYDDRAFKALLKGVSEDEEKSSVSS